MDWFSFLDNVDISKMSVPGVPKSADTHVSMVCEERSEEHPQKEDVFPVFSAKGQNHEVGTPGTRGKIEGVPTGEPHNPASDKDLQNLEHQEHPKTRNAEKTRDELRRFYSELAHTCGRVERERLDALPGWLSKLRELEKAFTSSWQAGEDPRGELSALQQHWLSGLGQIDAADETF